MSILNGIVFAVAKEVSKESAKETAKFIAKQVLIATAGYAAKRTVDEVINVVKSHAKKKK